MVVGPLSRAGTSSRLMYLSGSSNENLEFDGHEVGALYLPRAPAGDDARDRREPLVSAKGLARTGEHGRRIHAGYRSLRLGRLGGNSDGRRETCRGDQVSEVSGIAHASPRLSLRTSGDSLGFGRQTSDLVPV